MRKPFYQAMRCYKLQITRITARSKHAQAVLSGDALLQITNYKNYSRSKHAQVVLSGDALLQITNYKNYSKIEACASRSIRRCVATNYKLQELQQDRSMRKPFYQAMRCYKLQITRITADRSIIR
jgi:hypothetical protein